MPKSRHEVRLALVRLRLTRLSIDVVDAELAEAVRAPRMYPPVPCKLRIRVRHRICQQREAEHRQQVPHPRARGEDDTPPRATFEMKSVVVSR